MNNFIKKFKSKPRTKTIPFNSQDILWNKEIVARLYELEKNRTDMLELLVRWHITTELKLNGLLITKSQALNKAKVTWFNLKNSNLVDCDNLIVQGFRELYEAMADA